MKRYLILILLLCIGCGNTNKKEKDPYKFQTEVKFIKVSNMRYMIHTRSLQSLQITNLTLDSLMVEYYKKELK